MHTHTGRQSQINGMDCTVTYVRVNSTGEVIKHTHVEVPIMRHTWNEHLEHGYIQIL